jgi:hypothetical protein
MTEAEWHDCTDPRKMLDALRDSGQLTERKARLFAVAVCRRIWPLLTDERARKAVEGAERFADGLADAEELAAAASDADAASAGTSLPEEAIWKVVRSALFLDAGSSAYYAAFVACCGDEGRPAERRFELLLEAVTAEQGAQCGLLRDIVGSPFRRLPPLDPTWLTSVVVSIARRAYDERDFAALPVLADALEDAGCGDEDVLRHCREQGQAHCRGCWLIDLILGKG